MRGFVRVFAAVVTLHGSLAVATPVLLRGPAKTPTQPVSVTSFGGSANVVATPIKPDPTLTVVWLLDTFDSTARADARADLLALYAKPRGRSLKLAILHDGTLDLLGPFTTRTQLDKAISAVAPPAGTMTGAALLDSLVANAAQLGSRWSPVVLVGKLPQFDATVGPYAQSLLMKTFATQRLRVFLMSRQESDAGWSPILESLGGEAISDTASLAPLLDEVGQSFVEATWIAAEPPGGFVIRSATISDAASQSLATFPDLLTPSDSLPTIVAYAATQVQLAQLPAWLKEPPSAANTQRIRDVLLAAQVVNPVDPVVLQAEITLGEQSEDISYALKAATLLTVVRPEDGSSYATLGQALVLSSDFDGAETALNKAAELKVPADRLAEPFAKVHLGHKDERGALPYLEQALQADAKRQDLWALEAHIADHLHESALAINSYEQELALGGMHMSDSDSLLRLYLQTDDQAKAKSFALQTLSVLPRELDVRLQFAQILDGTKLASESLAAWRSVLEVQADVELAHVRVAQLLLASGDVKGAEAAATNSLQVLPKSGALFRTKSDAILQQGRAYEGRSALEEGASQTQDVAVLTHLALAQEVYGDRAAEAYADLANALPKGTPEQVHALQRGFSLALRDGNLKAAAKFSALLDADGHPESRAMLGEVHEPANSTLIPGGLTAFGYIARVKPGTSPDRFLAEYAAQITASICSSCMGDKYTSAVQAYLTTIAELETMGKRDGNRVSITLSVNGKDERNHTQNVLRLLGLQMHTDKGQLRLDRGEKESQGKKQDVLTGLEIDEVGLQEALQAGKPFEFQIHDEYAAIYPTAKMWTDSFPKERAHFELMLLHSPVMARLYLGMSMLDRPTVQALIGTSGLYWFQGRPADLLLMYGTCFAVEGTRAAVPGGAGAAPVWTQLVGVSPEKPGAFYQALLQQQNPKLLTFFFALSHLDSQHQTFFTANLARTKRFYDLFSTLPESQIYSKRVLTESPFSELLTSVPIDDHGHVLFPGSPELWTIAKGNVADDKKVASMMKKVSKAATPDMEDEVLLHLADTRYKSNSVVTSELANFLAVARIDAHRTNPMDEESALILAQHYSAASSSYPYFTEFPSLTAAGYRSYFNVMDGVAHQSALEQQMEMGQLHSLLEWVVLIRRRHAVDDTEAARLFTLICDRLAVTAAEDARTKTSMELAQTILDDCHRDPAAKWDDGLRACLLGPSAEANDQRGRDFQAVLEAQKAPSLEAVHAIVLAATTVGAGHVNPISPTVAALPAVPVPKDVKVHGKEKDGLLLYDPSHIAKLIAEWNQAAAKSPQNAKNLQRIASDLLKAMEPQVTLAVSAPVYAYFFRSTDLVVSEDPLLLRKHRFSEYAADSDRRLNIDSGFVQSSDDYGSHLEGGFAQIALASGFAAASGWKQGGQGGAAVVAEQIAAIRSTPWDQLKESDQRLVTLRVLAAREWITASAQDPRQFAALADETSGLLSMSRRSDLLNGIEQRNWQQVWASIMLPDMFKLGGSYLRRFPSPTADSPVIAQLRLTGAANDGSRLNLLGSIPAHAFGCDHAHLVPDAPYEEYERQQLPIYMAERSAEFKLFLAYRADSLGVRPEDLPMAAEKLAAKAFSISRMTDYHDWRSLLVAYASINNQNLKDALQQ